MPEASLRDRIRQLEDDLRRSPPAFILYRDLPFALFQYLPDDEWILRGELRKLATRLSDVQKTVVEISFADLLWHAIAQTEGLDVITEYERSNGFGQAQKLVNMYLSSSKWTPLADLVAERIQPLDPVKNVVFLTRAAALAPDIYPVSSLMESLYEHRLETPGVVFYPGTVDATTDGLRFMDLPGRSTSGSYRIKRYTSALASRP